MVHKFDSQKVFGFIFLSGIWILTFILINPFHDFPLNDDWAFSLTVKNLVEEGKYLPQEWLAIPFLSQALWGSLFCLPLGFSFNVLTLSTLTLGLLGVLMTYLIISEVSGSRFMALLAGLIVATNPLYTHLSIGFMSDVHFYAFFSLSIYLNIQYYKSKRMGFLILGAIFSLVATFVRQYGLVIPLGFMIFVIIYHKKRGRINLLIHLSTVILIGVLLIIYDRWLDTTDQTPVMYWSVDKLSSIGISIDCMGWRAFTRFGMILLNLGLWMFPVIFLSFISSFSLIKKHIKVIFIALIVLFFPINRMIGTFPDGNILFDFGLGPITTRDYFIDGFDLTDFSVPWFHYIIRPIAYAGGLMVVVLATLKLFGFVQIIRNNKQATKDFKFVAGIVAFFMFFLSFGITLINPFYFDRYNIPLIVIMLIIILPLNSIQIKRPRWIHIVVLAFFASQFIFGIYANRFYLEWNRVRWKAAREIMAEGIPANKIDGGFEFNYWHGEEVTKAGKWNPDHYDYVISFNKIKDYKVLKQYPVSGSLTRKTYEILVLERP